MSTTINEKSTELTKLLIPHRTTPIMQRVQTLVLNRTGKKLTEFLANGASEEDKLKVLDEVISIVKDERWSDLPIAAGGQQVSSSPTPMPSGFPHPAQPKPPAPPAAPAPKPDMPVNVATLPPASVAKPTPPAAPAPVVAVDPISAALAALTSALQAAKAPPPPAAPAAPSITDQDVRSIARKEMAAIFRTIADVLDKPTTPQ